jgi:hypothetical protein
MDSFNELHFPASNIYRFIGRPKLLLCFTLLKILFWDVSGFLKSHAMRVFEGERLVGWASWSFGVLTAVAVKITVFWDMSLR